MLEIISISIIKLMEKMTKGEEKTLSCELPLPEAGELLDPMVNAGVVFSFYAGTKE